MKEYIISVAIATITTSLADILTPYEWKKYVRILLGFLILFVIISPLSALKNIEIPEIDVASGENAVSFNDNISLTLKKNIETDIENRISGEFGIKVKAEVFIDTDSEHNIKGVKKIILTSSKAPENVINRLREVYGCETIEHRIK